MQIGDRVNRYVMIGIAVVAALGVIAWTSQGRILEATAATVIAGTLAWVLRR
jgi:hypothetical protein